MEPRISLITLGVADLERATRFYADCLELPQLETPPSVSFFELGTTWLALWSRESLAADAGLFAQGSGFRGFALADRSRCAAYPRGAVRRQRDPGWPSDRLGRLFRLFHRPRWRCLGSRAQPRLSACLKRTQNIRCDVIEVERVRGMRYRVQQDPDQKPTLLLPQ